MHSILRVMQHDDGATAVEYAVIASAIAAVVASSAVLLGGHTVGLFRGILGLWLVR